MGDEVTSQTQAIQSMLLAKYFKRNPYLAPEPRHPATLTLEP